MTPPTRAAVEQSDLHDDADRVRAWGARNPKVWTGIKYEGERLVVLLTQPVEHRDSLLRLVSHPDSLDVRGAAHTRRHLDEVYEAVQRTLEREPRSWSRSGPGLAAVEVSFHGGFEHLAEELHYRFGDAIHITVGVFAYPLVDPVPGALGAAPRSTVDLPNATVEALPAANSTEVGTTVSGVVRITNTSATDTLTIDTDRPLDGTLLNAADEVVGISTAFMCGTGYRVTLEPGGSASIDFRAGTDSLDVALGSTLPPGAYRLVVEIPLHGFGSPQARVVTPAVPIRLCVP